MHFLNWEMIKKTHVPQYTVVVDTWGEDEIYGGKYETRYVSYNPN